MQWIDAINSHSKRICCNPFLFSILCLIRGTRFCLINHCTSILLEHELSEQNRHNRYNKYIWQLGHGIFRLRMHYFTFYLMLDRNRRIKQRYFEVNYSSLELYKSCRRWRCYSDNATHLYVRRNDATYYNLRLSYAKSIKKRSWKTCKYLSTYLYRE